MKKWIRRSYSSAPDLVDRIAQGRNISEIGTYTSPAFSGLGDPKRLHGLTRAAERFAQAIEGRESILVHGDYDVDGSTATAILGLLARAAGHNIAPWIPDRKHDGYGLTESSLAVAAKHRPQLIVTVDCGIADGGYAARMEAASGGHVVITDHHLPAATLPSCHAVVNPNHPDDRSGLTYLSGAAVAWMLAWQTARLISRSDKVSDPLRQALFSGLELVAIGSVADCVPLIGENRILVHEGLKLLNQPQSRMGSVLRGPLKIDEFSGQTLGWRVGPVLNASGRMTSAMRNMRILLEEGPDRELALAEAIEENRDRRDMTDVVVASCGAALTANPDLARDMLVLAGEGWHEGVVGIAAGRLLERYHVPTCVLSIRPDGTAKGSLRSIDGVNIAACVQGCHDLIQRGGGHPKAAGVTMATGQIDAFRERMRDQVRAQQAPLLGVPHLVYDADAAVSEIAMHPEAVATLSKFGPFGMGNPHPTVRLSGKVLECRILGANLNVLRFTIGDGTSAISCIKFGFIHEDGAVPVVGEAWDAVGKPEFNIWNGSARLQIGLDDYRLQCA